LKQEFKGLLLEHDDLRKQLAEMEELFIHERKKNKNFID
jgi:hypothetical protein